MLLVFTKSPAVAKEMRYSLYIVPVALMTFKVIQGQ